ncbi:hypothetical protein B7486_71955, partial [cyanobacterium TDX16]
MNTSTPDARDQEPLRRVVVEGVRPTIEGGPVKRTVGELLEVSADVFADGHDVVRASLLVLAPEAERWREVPMEDLGNDRWSGTFTVAELGTWHYAVRGWVDRFATWQRDTMRKVEAGLDVVVELLEGASLVEEAATRAPEQAARTLRAVAVGFRQGDTSVLEDEDPGLGTAMARLADRSAASTSA